MRRESRAISLVLLFATVFAPIPALPQFTSHPDPTISSPNDADYVVLIYSKLGSAYAGPLPNLRLYADGLLHVYRPYAKTKHYETRLPRSQVEEIIRSIASRGILELSNEKIKELQKKAVERRLSEQQRAGAGPGRRWQTPLRSSSDPGTTVIGIRLKEYRRSQGSERHVDLLKVLSWTDRYKETAWSSDTQIRALRDSVRDLSDLMNHRNLQSVPWNPPWDLKQFLDARSLGLVERHSPELLEMQ